MRAIRSRRGSSTRTPGSQERAAEIRSPRRCSSGAHRETKAVGVGVEGDPAPDDRGAEGGIAGRGDVHREAEAVEELGAQVALLRIHRPHQDEAGGVGDGQALSFHAVGAAGGGVEDEVDQVVGEEIDFVHVENGAVGGGEEAGLEAPLAALDGGLEVEGAGDAVLRRADWQLHQGHRPRFGHPLLSGGVSPGAPGAGAGRALRGAAVGAPGDDRDTRQQRWPGRGRRWTWRCPAHPGSGPPRWRAARR